MKARQEQTKTVHVDYKSAQDGFHYIGSFVIKKLSIKDIAALGVRKVQLNGGMHFDPEKPGFGVEENTDDLNNMLAHLELSIQTAPKWWDLGQITDVELLGVVFKEVVEFEQTFLRRKAGAENAGRNDNSGSEGNVSQTDNRGVARAVVDKEVQAALEP